MAHILSDTQDVIAQHRELQRQLQAHEITPREYQAAFRDIDAQMSTRPLCANSDGRIATAVVDGRNLCSACWLIARGKAGRT